MNKANTKKEINKEEKMQEEGAKIAAFGSAAAVRKAPTGVAEIGDKKAASAVRKAPTGVAEIGDKKAAAKAAFTMIELVFVIVILGILSAIVVPKFSSVKKNAEFANYNTALRVFHDETVRKQLLDEADSLEYPIPSWANTCLKQGHVCVNGRLINALKFTADDTRCAKEVQAFMNMPNNVITTFAGHKNVKITKTCPNATADQAKAKNAFETGLGSSKTAILNANFTDEEIKTLRAAYKATSRSDFAKNKDVKDLAKKIKVEGRTPKNKRDNMKNALSALHKAFGEEDTAMKKIEKERTLAQTKEIAWSNEARIVLVDGEWYVGESK